MNEIKDEINSLTGQDEIQNENGRERERERRPEGRKNSGPKHCHRGR